MNRLLARSIGFLNVFIALILVLGGAGLGAAVGQKGGSTGAGVVLGLIAGFIMAVLVCGVLALFIETLNELKKIRSDLESRSA